MLTILSEVKPKHLSGIQQISDSLLALVGEADQLTEKAQVVYESCKDSKFSR